MPADLKTESFFPRLDGFRHRGIFRGVSRPWDALGRIGGYIAENPGNSAGNAVPSGLVLMEGADGGMIFCERPVVLEKDFVCRALEMTVGAGTKIEPAALMKGPAIIGKNCEIRHGAYLRGGLITGDHCTLGHATEIKNAVIMDHTECGHFNYIGDSVIGSFVNLGAGTKVANLKFRSPEEKEKVLFPEISFRLDGITVKTGVSKLGAIIGDYAELGCNSVTNPAVLLMPECMVYPNATVPSGLYARGSVIRP